MDRETFDKIADVFAADSKARVFFSRQFYSTTKHVKITAKTFATCVRISTTGKLQIWEGKAAGGWINVIGTYRITAD